MDVGQRSPTASDQLRLAASKGQLDQVIECLRAGATFEPDQDGRTALHYAALNGFTDVTRFLVDKGCDINIQDDSGYTALHRAASQGHVDVISALLDYGCDVNMQDEHGNGAIHEAAWNGFSRTLELLVKHDVNCSIVNKAGFTALHLAAQNGHNESSRVLLYAGCNSDLKNNYGDTTLHTAARYGHAGVTRILISARAKLNEQNKNGDTALHIAAALKRRKIAKLLVESGIDVSVKNKQNETAMDVARRKDHDEIILIIQSYCRPGKQPLKEVNFNMDMHEIDGPVYVPDMEPVESKPEEKPEKGKRFLFFKKKKNKDKTPPSKGSVSPPGQNCAVHVGNRPVQGFFSKYVPKEGVQYYRDLAGNVKKGPVGYIPSCNCLPVINKLQKEVHDTQDHVYGHIQSNTRAMQDRINEVDYRSSMRVQALEKFTHDRFHEEEQLCNQRINQRFDENGKRHNDHMKSQIQNWLEQKLEGYGHCLHHHHDDTALPNENIFSDIHETANGRLFKSRSDETLSQSDNHSGRFRKREFYESRQQAMQQIRAWQVPSYSKDRSRLKVSDKPPSRNNVQPERRTPSRQHVNFDPDPPRQYPVEARVEVRNNRNPQLSDRNAQTVEDNQTYMSMGGSHNPGATQKYTALPQPQVYQSKRTVQGSRGPVIHSTPKSSESSPYAVQGGMVRSQTDGVLNRNSPGVHVKQLTFQDNTRDSSPGSNSHRYNSYEGKSELKSSYSEHQINPAHRASSPVKSGIIVNSGYRHSTSSDRVIPETPKPTFTTFGYDDTHNGSTAPTNSPENQSDQSYSAQNTVNNVTTPRSNSSLSNREEQNKTQLTDKSLFSSFNSQGSLGFTPSHQEEPYVEMRSLSPRLHHRTRSSEGLLETDLDRLNSPRSHSEDRHLDTRDAPLTSMQSRSSSETRGVLNPRPSPVPAPQQPSRALPQTPGSFYSRNQPYPFYNSPTQSQTSSFMRSPEKPVPAPKPIVQKPPYPYAAVGEVKRERVYTGNIAFKLQPKSCGSSTNTGSDNIYSTVKGAQTQKERNLLTVTADVHPSMATYYTHSSLNGGSSVTNTSTNHLEPRSKTAYQTYLTEGPQPQFQGSNGHIQRESSPNVCNNSKEDSSSNPDSGYSSKIYGNRPGSVQPPSCGSTPSSSFSTDRGLPSSNNSPQSQYSNTDYEYLPKRQYEDEVQTHVQSWYQRKLQETTQKVYDSWRSDKAGGHVSQIPRQQGRYYGNGEYGDYAMINQVQNARTVQQNGGMTGYTMSGQQNHMVSTYAIHGSDV